MSLVSPWGRDGCGGVGKEGRQNKGRKQANRVERGATQHTTEGPRRHSQWSPGAKRGETGPPPLL